MQTKHYPPQKNTFSKYWAPKWLRGLVAFFTGCMLIDMGLSVLGIRIEWYTGLDTFSGAWIAAMFVVPITVGVIIGIVYGFGGKYLAHFPPVAVLSFSYYESVTHFPLPDGVHLLPWPLWAFFLILQMEFCALGGVIGELLYHRHVGWDNRVHYRADSDPLPEQDDSRIIKDKV